MPSPVEDQTATETKRLPFMVDRPGRESIQSAITLRLALQGLPDSGDNEDRGIALAQICQAWQAQTLAELRGGRS